MSGTILIVDDEDEIRAVLTEYLEGKGYNVFEAPDLAQARRQLRTGLHPDLVVLDVVLRDGDGITFLRELRSLTASGDVPVIVVSAHRTTSKDKAAGLEFGADDYVAKPFDLREIGLRIERLIKPRRNGRRATDIARSARSQEDATTALKKILSAEGFPSAPGRTAPKSANRDLPAALGKALSEETGDDLVDDIDDAPPAVTPRLIVGAFFRLLLEPKKFFSSDISPQLPPLVAYISLILAGVLAGIQRGVEAQTFAAGFINSLMFPIIYAGAAAFIAWFIHWVMGLRRKPVTFKSMFVAVALGFAPLAVAAFLGVVYVVAGNGIAGDFTAGPLLAFPAQAGAQYLGAALRRLDLFEFWAFWIAAMALRHGMGSNRRVVYRWVFAAWLTAIAASTILHHTFS